MSTLELRNQISHRFVELFAAAHSAHIIFTQLLGVCHILISLMRLVSSPGTASSRSMGCVTGSPVLSLSICCWMIRPSSGALDPCITSTGWPGAHEYCGERCQQNFTIKIFIDK